MTRIRIGRISLAALGVAVVAATAPASVGAQALDTRWQAWSGCWAPVAPQAGSFGNMTSNAIVCVVPAQGTSAVEVVTVVGGKIDDRTRIEADGNAHPVTREGCTGTESATWAATGTRVYLTSDLTCSGGVKRSGKGVMSFSQRYEWLEVRGVQSGEASGVAVSRYVPLADTTGIPAEIARLVPARGAAANNAILAAAGPLSLADVADVSISTDSGVATTWLVERTADVKLSITGKQLAALADQGVPGSVIDVLVAIAHPTVFALDARSGEASLKPQQQGSRVANAYGYRGLYGSSYCSGWMSSRMSYYGMYSPFYYGSAAFDPCYSPYDVRYSAFRYGGYYGYGYGGYGYYPGSQPIIVVTRGDDSPAAPRHGRVTKGQGYTEGRGSSGSSGGSSTKVAPGGGSTTGGSSGSGSVGSGGAASGTSSSGASSSGGERTAVRKPPQ